MNGTQINCTFAIDFTGKIINHEYFIVILLNYILFNSV